MEVLLTRWCWGWIRQAAHPVEHEFLHPVVVMVEVLPDDVLAGRVGCNGVQRRLVHVLLQRHRENLRPQLLQLLRLLLGKDTVFERILEDILKSAGVAFSYAPTFQYTKRVYTNRTSI